MRVLGWELCYQHFPDGAGVRGHYRPQTHHSSPTLVAKSQSPGGHQIHTKHPSGSRKVTKTRR